MQSHYTSLNKYQWLEMDGQLNLPRKLDFRLFLCLERKKESLLFKQVLWVIACVLHNLIYGDSTVTYVSWSEFSILGISSSFSQKRGRVKK